MFSIYICTFILLNRQEYVQLIELCVTVKEDKVIFFTNFIYKFYFLQDHVFTIIDDLFCRLSNNELDEFKGYVKTKINVILFIFY